MFSTLQATYPLRWSIPTAPHYVTSSLAKRRSSQRVLRLAGRSVRREQWWGNPECQQRISEVYPYVKGRTTEQR
jgi:hypothetical protein